MLSLNTPLAALLNIAKVRERTLSKLGLKTISDLLFYFPFRYDDLRRTQRIKDLKAGETVTLKVRVDLLANKRSLKKKMFLTEALVSDDSGSLKIIWFNQPFIAKVLKPGDTVFLAGQVDDQGYNLQLINPAYEKFTRHRKEGATLHTGRLVPVYPVTEGLTSKQLRLLVSKILPIALEIDDILPLVTKQQYKLIGLTVALQQIHFPDNEQGLESARRRLKFEELFIIHLYTQKLRLALKDNQAYEVKFFENETKDFVNGLPFTLTLAQKKCAWEILQDIGKQSPMNRLLQGDVGSGKTVVAAVAVLNVFFNKYQTALLAPTEILAAQHFDTFSRLFKNKGIKIALMTRTLYKFMDTAVNEVQVLKKKELQEKISRFEADLVIGTHSLLQEKISFNSLALVIVDEQHRFGVKQRQLIAQKGESFSVRPHFLSMTATPIPRTLALSFYGDLDLSLIDQLPPNRKPVLTRLIFEQERDKAYDFIKEQLALGRQCFIICPLVEESDKLGVKSVELEYEKLRQSVFSANSVGKLHGKLNKKEKSAIMEDFSQKKYDILIATSVVEVGVDVPNATVMLIEGAERFGLAQLHQFRGRVGRAGEQSYCLLFSTDNNADNNQRLQYFVKCHNGFELAEKDLELRGSGEVFGTKQSGITPLRIASLTDSNLIKETKEAAKQILSQDRELTAYPLLAKQVHSFENLTFLE